MFEFEDSIIDVRKHIYHDAGFYTIKNYLNTDELKLIRENWSDDIAYEFHNFIKNLDVRPGTPPYVYNKPSKDDFAYCTHIWNEPYDQLLHAKAVNVQLLRNQVEGKPLYHGLHESTGMALQYRVCRTVSSSHVVKKHADFFDEYRHDPTGSHQFDPSRLQATLFLSDYDVDYTNGGFILWDDERKVARVFGRDVPVKAGDLVFWRYSLPHEVNHVSSKNDQFGFMRVIFPLFEIGFEMK